MKFFPILFCISATALVTLGFAKEKIQFVKPEDMPKAISFLPPPPEKGSLSYSADSVRYLQGKAQRNSPRGDSAIQHANGKPASLLKFFGSAIGIPLNENDYPITASLVRSVSKATKATIKETKKTYARHRPYQDFKEPTSVPSEESPTDFTSYPSGHTTRAWAVALLFVMLDPAHQNEILKMGYEMGQSRVIAGFHYQSDVDAARLAASAAFARLCAEPQFLEMVQKAKQEIRQKKSSP